MPATGALNRLQEIRNENAANINPAKNQQLNQAPKSAFKDLTNAKAGLNIQGGKPGSSFRTPQITNKKESKVKEKETIQIYLDDFCTSLPKKHHNFPEINWNSLDTEKLSNKFSKPMKSECGDYELFKDDEFVLQPLADPEPPIVDFDTSVDGLECWAIPEIKPMKFEDLPELDFSDIDFNTSF